MTTLLHASTTLAAGIAEAGRTTTGEAVLFWILAPVMVISALGLIFAKRTVYAAMSVVLVMISLAVLYVAQEAPFLGIVQVIVYTGAVMMLFLFVLMLVGVDTTDSLVETIRGQRFWAIIAGLGFAGLLALAVGNAVFGSAAATVTADPGGNVVALAKLIFTRYVFAFEVTSALLITAALAAMVLAHRERTAPKPTQKDISRARFQAFAEKGRIPTPLPGPGTYARHNAVDMPALLPDGTVSELSVNRVIARRDGDGREDEVREAVRAQRAVEKESGE